MRKLPAVLAITTLSVVTVVLIGLLARSTSRAATLERRVATLEAERRELRKDADIARRQASALQRQTSVLQARLQPIERKEAAVRGIDQELTVEAGTTRSFQFTPTVVPGTLSVTWRSSGQGFGGANDTISAFRLTDPDDVQLDASPAGPVEKGRVLVKVTKQGTYTLWFDNKGLLRNTSRRIFIEGEFRPD